ncbi:MAG: LuxR C-terminal-related transcriptional regulator [Oscillospiraceae bacterium]|nr:LuxR C-terminal-related transcriptional regulator [Oscillospiraceae bacterium]
MNTAAAKRAELMKKITGLAGKKIVYIHAPAGYGKSFSIRMWAENSGRPYIRIALNGEVNSKPALFYENFTAALSKLQRDNGDLRELVKHHAFSTAPVEFTLRALSAFITDEKEYILILDDLHLITNTELLSKLVLFIGQLPENITLFLLSRAAPPDSFAEYTVKDAFAILEAKELIFTAEEIKALFAAYGQTLTQRQADDVLSSTGGWAIAINAVLLSGAEPSTKKLAERHWETFIQNEVWNKWDERTQRFMMKASITDSLTPELCEALTGEKKSGELLDRLVRENAFLSAYDENTYSFHHLFQQFLHNMFKKESHKLQSDTYQKAGAFFYKHKDYFKSVTYYLQSGDAGGIAKGLKKMYDYNSPYAAIEDTLAIIRLSVDGSIVEKHPFLLEVQAWAAFVDGRAKDMEETLDRYHKLFPKIVVQNPASVQTRIMLRCMDYRNSLIGVTKSIKRLPLTFLAKAGTPSITQNLPFFHRSGRDFSEYITDTDHHLSLLQKTVGAIVGEEYGIMEVCLRAGLHYEQGELAKAHTCALEANAKIRGGFAPEVKFCAMMILAETHHATGQTEDAQKAIGTVNAMIECDRAYYLGANLEAYICRCKLEDGDEGAAKKWLRETAATGYDELSFFKLYQHFTTARAYITAGDFNTAILFAKRLLALCEAYHRPLDIIEAKILLSIATWKKGRGYQTEATAVITDAIISAYPYGCTQVFANEGAELVNMLHRLHLAAGVKDYSGELPGAFAKTLYIMALSHSKTSKGLTGGRMMKPLTFTDQQKAVMRLLCEGLSQQAIACRLGLKVTGVKSHLQLIYRKLDVPVGIDAVMKIRELGLLDH